MIFSVRHQELQFYYRTYYKVPKRKHFLVDSKAETGFQLVKHKMIEALVLTLLAFEKMFEVNCDAYGKALELFLTRMGAPSPFLVRNYPA